MNIKNKEILIRLCLDTCIVEKRPVMQSFVINNFESFDKDDVVILTSTIKQMKTKTESDLVFLRDIYSRTIKFDVDKVGVLFALELAHLNIICKKQLNINTFSEIGLDRGNFRAMK